MFIFLIILNSEYASNNIYGTSAASDLRQYDAAISLEKSEYSSLPNETLKIPAKITNNGTMNWLKDKQNTINISYHIYNENNNSIIVEGIRTYLPYSVKPGETFEGNIDVVAPNISGEYTVEFDIVYENVTWFKDKGSTTKEMILFVK